MRNPSAPASGRRERGGDASSTSAGHGSVKGRLRSRRLLVLAATVFVALAAAATTQASSGIVGYFELGGEFEGSLINPENESGAKVGDIDVNANGAGAADPGDVYVLAGGVQTAACGSSRLPMTSSVCGARTRSKAAPARQTRRRPSGSMRQGARSRSASKPTRPLTSPPTRRRPSSNPPSTASPRSAPAGSASPVAPATPVAPLPTSSPSTAARSPARISRS